jgi:hypothetical protein
MKVKDFFAMIEKAKKDMTPQQMEQEMELYVSNPHSIHDMQSGEYGVTPQAHRRLHIL